MKTILTRLMFGLVFFASLSRADTHVVVSNHSYKSVYYIVVGAFSLHTHPGLSEVRTLRPWQKERVYISPKDVGILSLLVLENTGPLDELEQNGTVVPVCEISSQINSNDLGWPLRNHDLVNMKVGKLYCRVSHDSKSLIIDAT